MVEAKMQELLIAKITELDQVVKSGNSSPLQYGLARKAIKELVNLFNANELSKLVSIRLLCLVFLLATARLA